MNDTRHTQSCRQLSAAPGGVWTLFKQRVAERCSAHIASCPRCQKRLARIGRVELAFCLMRMQPQAVNLLANANTAALKYLKRSLRETPRAETLRAAVYGPGRLEKAAPHLERLLNWAACLFVVLLIRTGVTHKLFEIKEQGTAVIENYYARHLDAQIFEDIFGQPPDHKA